MGNCVGFSQCLKLGIRNNIYETECCTCGYAVDDGYANHDRWHHSATFGISYGEMVGYHLEWNLYCGYLVYRNLCYCSGLANLFQAD
ncbi:hypothetical protein D3C76_1554900 [compost metagenome]